MRGAHSHPSFTQVGHPCMLLRYPILQDQREIHGMPEVAAPLALQQLFCNRDM